MVEVESAIRLAEFIDLVDNSTALDASPALNERHHSDSRHWRRGGFDGGVGLSSSVFAEDGYGATVVAVGLVVCQASNFN